jgi:hypothetical protein
VDFKKHVFSIVLGVIVVGAAGFYALTVPAISADAERLKTEYTNKANEVKKLADAASKPDGIKSPRHVKLAKDYQDGLKKNIDMLKEAWAAKAKLAVQDDKAPKGIEFEGWLAKRRDEIMAKAAKAGLELPGARDAVSMEKLLFADTPTDDRSAKAELHRDYRLRHLAIIEEVVDVLSKKWGRQKISKWSDGGVLKESDADVGVLKLERLAIAPAPRKPGDALKMLTDAAQLGGRGSTLGKEVKFSELPYTVTPVDIVFVAPLSAVSSIVRDLESRERYLGVVSRLDLQRVSQPFPVPDEEFKKQPAGPIPMLNTYFQEAPVRVLVTLDLYEYDKAKEADAEKPVAAK